MAISTPIGVVLGYSHIRPYMGPYGLIYGYTVDMHLYSGHPPIYTGIWPYMLYLARIAPYMGIYGHIQHCTVQWSPPYALYPPLIHTVATPDPLYPGMAVYTVYTPILCHIRYHTVHIRPTLYCTGIHPYTAYWPPLYTGVSRICPYMGHIAVYTGTWPTP